MIGHLKAGEKAKIIDLTHVSELVRRRLHDLGFTEGSEVCIKNAMPFGGPVMIENGGQCIGIRRTDANRIEVERL